MNNYNPILLSSPYVNQASLTLTGSGQDSLVSCLHYVFSALLIISRLDVLARASLRTFTSRSHLWISLLCFFLCFFPCLFLFIHELGTLFYIFNTIYGAFDSFVPQIFLFIHELRMPFYIFNAIYGALDSFVLLKLLAALAPLNNFLSFLNILALLLIHSFQLCWAFHAFNYFSVLLALLHYLYPRFYLLKSACKLTFQNQGVKRSRKY